MEAEAVEVEPTPVPVPAPPAETNGLTITPAASAAPEIVFSFPTNQWIAWESWSDAKGWAKPKKVSSTANPSYELRGPHGVMGITIGSQSVSWNGVNVGLGHVPKLVNGQPAVYGLDIYKNFEPLLSASTAPVKERRVIVVDAGHGGMNAGAKSALYDAYEKEYTLDWALRLEPLLRERGWTVILTRTNDIDLALSNRVAIAESAQADLFISLHFNSLPPGSPRGALHGIETYCTTPVGLPSNLTREFDDDRRKVFANNYFDIQNLQYAVRLHRALVEKTGRVDRGIRRARFMGVLRDQNRPAVLLEGGYLSHPVEARLIASAEYRQKLAQALADALAP